MLMCERTLINVFNFPVSCFPNYLIIRIVIFNILFLLHLPPSLFFIKKDFIQNNIIFTK